MNQHKTIKACFIFGTRPEAIKLAPLIIELNKYSEFEIQICLTGQHKEMLDQVLINFDIKENTNLHLMRDNQSLVDFASKALPELNNYLAALKPNLVIVHGDTSTALYGALAAFYNKVSVAHIEAGLRTNNKYSPFPEEINRTLVAKLSDYHFSPTALSKQNLLKENIDPSRIFVTGNTVIDALLLMLDKQRDKSVSIDGLPDNVLQSENRIVLITMHRRENFGEGIIQICEAISELANQNRACNFIYPVHPNPNVVNPVEKLLSGIPNVYLIKPLAYDNFVFMMNRSYIILTDSGGVQEEAPSLGKPVLVLRDNTERPEALEAGTVKLVGTNKKNIVDSVNILLNDEAEYKKMAEAINPYGDGTACRQIRGILLREVNG